MPSFVQIQKRIRNLQLPKETSLIYHQKNVLLTILFSRLEKRLASGGYLGIPNLLVLLQ